MKFQIKIGGFQRSGNTYLAEQVSRRYGVDLTSEQKYNHDIENHSKYISTNQKFPFVVPVRDAKESIASYYVHEKKLNGTEKLEENIEGRLKNLADLWHFVLGYSIFFVAPFSEFTSNTENFFKKLESTHSVLVPFIDPNADLSSTYRDLELRELSSIPQEIYLEVGHLPRNRTPEYGEALEYMDSKKFEEKFVLLDDMQKKLNDRY